MGNENNDFNQHLVSKFVNACLKSDGIKPDYPNFLKYSTFKNEEVCQSLFASLLSMDTTELKKLISGRPTHFI